MFWRGSGALVPLILGLLPALLCLARIYLVEKEDPLSLLHQRSDRVIRWLLLHRRSPGTLPFGIALILAALVLHQAALGQGLGRWVILHPGGFVAGHGVAFGLLAWLRLVSWDPAPGFLARGEIRADAQFMDIPEDWGPRPRGEGRAGSKELPTAELLGFRCPSKLARRVLEANRLPAHLTLISLRWDILSRHLFLLGPQGSGKTTTVYGHIMHSTSCPFIYQDSKAELPFRTDFPDLPVWGLDVRGHESRSGVFNPLSEIRGPEDRDLVVDYVFPVNPHDANPWVREMARVLFGAILEARPWESLQEIHRALRATRLEPFLETLEPVWRDLMKEPKSQVPILQDLVATLSRWDTERVRSITEGPSTVTLDEFIERGGFVLNCEDSDALKAPVHLFWAMLLGRLRNRPEGASPLLLLLDEFGDCGRIPNIQRALVLLRSKGVSIVAGIQNLGLLQDVYPRDWKAVLEGFGTRIWLARNLEDDLRLKLTQAIGRFTRRIPAQGSKARPGEKESDLMPLDAWGTWSQARAALGRLNGFSYWLPVPLSIPRTPLGMELRGKESGGERLTGTGELLTGGTPLEGRELELPKDILMEPKAEGPATNLSAAHEEDWL